MASTTAQVSIAAKATGAGSTVDFLAAVSRVSGVIVTVGTVSGGAVAVEASQDGLNWVTLQVHQPRTGRVIGCDNMGMAYRYYRVNILSDITGGGSVTVTFMEAN